jgi:hypothetical protein
MRSKVYKMRINIIGNFAPRTGLQHDSLLLRGILTHVFGESVDLCRVHYVQPECGRASANIFLEVFNPSLLSYAQTNIWIPNPEWTYQTWHPYLELVDHIWVKTREAEDILRPLTKTPVTYIGWTSIDKGLEGKKNYSQAIVLVGKNIYRSPKQLLRAYLRIKETDPVLYAKLPELHIPHQIPIHCPDELHGKVHCRSESLSDSDYTNLLHTCGLAICTSASEGFGHAVNEAMSASCALLLSPIRPFQELTHCHPSVLWAEPLRTVDHPDCYGTLVDVTVDSLIHALRTYVGRGLREKQAGSAAMRPLYETRHADWVARMEPLLRAAIEPREFVPDLPKEEDLPDVSIITVTRDRRVFMPLAKYSYLIQSYPEDKLEWVIVDDGDDPIEDTLIGVPNVQYIRCDSKLTIGAKRNLGIQRAMYDVLVMMDDDDIYPNNSVLQRVAMLMQSPRKECTFCTTIPCYDITRFSSFMNVPPHTLGMSDRVSEATLACTRDFWKARPFDDVQIAEGCTFIRGREQMCREGSPQECIVSLVHPKNTSSRKLPEQNEPNGCHYGLNETLYAMVTQIGQSLLATSSPSSEST